MSESSDRNNLIADITFTGIVFICEKAGINTQDQTLKQLRTLLIKDTNISLEPGLQYRKKNQIQHSKVIRASRASKGPIKNDNETKQPKDEPVAPVAPKENVVVNVEENKDVVENKDVIESKDVIDVPENDVVDVSGFRVPMETGITAKKKGIFVVLDGDSTFIGAFTTQKALLNALDDSFPGIDISAFKTEQGHDGIRVVSFGGDVLLNYKVDADNNKD